MGALNHSTKYQAISLISLFKFHGQCSFARGRNRASVSSTALVQPMKVDWFPPVPTFYFTNECKQHEMAIETFATQTKTNRRESYQITHTRPHIHAYLSNKHAQLPRKVEANTADAVEEMKTSASPLTDKQIFY